MKVLVFMANSTYFTGAVYLFSMPDINPSGKLIPETPAVDDFFGYSVAVSHKGPLHVYVGAYGASGSKWHSFPNCTLSCISYYTLLNIVLLR